MGIKILFLSHRFFPEIGGIETNSEILAAGFSAAGHQVKLLTWSVYSGSTSFAYEVIRNPSVLTLIKQHAWADLVFENNPCVRMGWPALLFRHPTVIALNTWISRTDGRMSLRDKVKIGWWLKRSKRVIAVSDALRKVCWPSAIVIGNPYRKADFKIMPGVNRDRDFVFLGRLVSDKGADQAILALHRLVAEQVDRVGGQTLQLTIIGDGPDRSKLESLVSSLDLTHHVHFTGSLRSEALCAALNRHRFILVPSAWEEPFGNVVLEGIACGCIPIASDGGGLPEAVGNAGLTFPRNDLDGFVSCIRQLLANPELVGQYRAAGRKHLIDHYPDRVAEHYLNVLQNCMGH